MQEFLIYNLKVGACLAVFYLFYKLLLSRDTFHRFNRVVLMAVIALSFVLPLCVVTIYKEAPAVDPVSQELLHAYEFVPADIVLEAPDEAVVNEKPDIEWGSVLNILFAAGIICSLLITVIAIARILAVVRSGERERLDRRTVLVKKQEEVTPFSWLRYIVISIKDLTENGCDIIAHERAHIRLRHSYDLLLADICGCLQWFNPAMWLLKQELRSIHEYEADREVIASGADPKNYQLLLIRKAVGSGRYSIANSLNHSKLKNRITMMLRKKSPVWARAKALLLVPLALAAVTAFARTEYAPPGKFNENNGKLVRLKSDTLFFNSAKLITPNSDTIYIASGHFVTLPQGERQTGRHQMSVEHMDGKPFTGSDRIKVAYGRNATIKYGPDKGRRYYGSASDEKTVTDWMAVCYPGGLWSETNGNGTSVALGNRRSTGGLWGDKERIGIVMYADGRMTIDDVVVGEDGLLGTLHAVLNERCGNAKDYTFLVNYGASTSWEEVKDIWEILSDAGAGGLEACGGLGNDELASAGSSDPAGETSASLAGSTEKTAVAYKADIVTYMPENGKDRQSSRIIINNKPETGGESGEIKTANITIVNEGRISEFTIGGDERPQDMERLEVELRKIDVDVVRMNTDDEDAGGLKSSNQRIYIITDEAGKTTVSMTLDAARQMIGQGDVERRVEAQDIVLSMKSAVPVTIDNRGRIEIAGSAVKESEIADAVRAIAAEAGVGPSELDFHIVPAAEVKIKQIEKVRKKLQEAGAGDVKWSLESDMEPVAVKYSQSEPFTSTMVLNGNIVINGNEVSPGRIVNIKVNKNGKMMLDNVYVGDDMDELLRQIDARASGEGKLVDSYIYMMLVSEDVPMETIDNLREKLTGIGAQSLVVSTRVER